MQSFSTVRLRRFALVMAVLCSSLLLCGDRYSTAQEAAPQRCYLIGNSLTWDTVPGLLSGDVQWHVDCGVHLQQIVNKPDTPCVMTSTLWPKALQDKQYDVVSVQPFYGTTLAQDVEVISNWMKLQPKAVFVIHSGWARQGPRADEFASYATPLQMNHGPVYFRALLSELRRLHPGREIRQTLCQNLLALIADDIAANRAPLKNVTELYRDDIHVTHSHGKYLMHNAMRRAFGQAPSSAGFNDLDPGIKKYLDGTLSWLATSAADKKLLQQILAVDAADRAGLIQKLSDATMKSHMTTLLPEIEQAAKKRAATVALEATVNAVGGRLISLPSAPQWLYLATGDVGTEIFDVPTAVDLYNGNNPLKGKGGRNEQVTDDWLRQLANAKTLKRLDLANCAIQGSGLQHLKGLTGLRELNLTLTPVSDDALQHVGSLTEMRSLGLASTQCTGTGFVHLKSLRHLESVNFHFTPLNDAGLEAISQVPISGRLWFAHTKFTDAGAVHLKHQTQLKRCGIGSANKDSSGAAVAALTAMPLEDLSLLDNQATTEGLLHAAKIKTLRRLDASHAPTVNDESMPLIAQLPALEEFKLGSAQITDAGLQALVASKSLKKLSLSGNKKLTPAGLEQARKAARPELTIEAN